jgi:hypothetical protein
MYSIFQLFFLNKIKWNQEAYSILPESVVE